MVFADAVGFAPYCVDSDIQYGNEMIKFHPQCNNYVFDDYIYYPNLDSYGGDITEAYADIPVLKKMADETKNCIAFNTYGWLKHKIVDIAQLKPLTNKYYISDGIYIKKSYLDTMNK